VVCHIDGEVVRGLTAQHPALARALLKPSSVLILDEATSALDYRLEGEIYDDIQSRFEDKIVVIVAHRLSTVVNSDRICVMERGRIRATGSHYDLLESSELYRDLYQSTDAGAEATPS
jgi:ABC-type multidrug transport system fused ATPase/permease subunit